MMEQMYIKQVQLLLHLLPTVSKVENFQLKGGTAINFFVRDIPRLSVDIDLVYGLISDRQTALAEINRGMELIAGTISSRYPSYRIQEKRVAGCLVTLYVTDGQAMVKLEINTILRGFVFPGEEREVSGLLSRQLGIDMFVTARILSLADLYGGKICAALDRQHPRDLFDIKILFEHEGFTDDIRRAFIIYLTGHDRPMSELLDPKRMDMRNVFESEFRGMTDYPIQFEELTNTFDVLLSTIRTVLTSDERQFLLSLKSGEPAWSLSGVEGVEHLPSLRWKLENVRRMPKEKHRIAFEKLKRTLEV
jgi:predicted nucleotidyltransferase component of viral defense system